MSTDVKPMPAPGLSMFVCDSPWESYLDQLQAETDRQQEELERQEDLDQEKVLAREAVIDLEAAGAGAELEHYVPFYADEVLEIMESEIFTAGEAEHLPLLACDSDEPDDSDDNDIMDKEIGAE
jgi:hypothetical protein